jgi:Domain of unknown function (DUF6438)
MLRLSQINRLILLAVLAVLTIGRGNCRFAIVEASPQEVPSDTVITLERTACYGTCPIYKLTISADGGVVFEGLRFVKSVGTAKTTISKEQFRELLARFEKLDYFDLRDRYEQPDDGCKQWVTDNPSVITSIRTNGKSKSVRHYYGCWGVEVLAELTKLERAIDDAVNSAQWIR